MDISGYGPFRWNMLRYAIDTCGVEKMIFGSDMPTCSAGMYLYSVLVEHLTEEEFTAVLAGNFKRLVLTDI
jgi:predicted TIM-barrel fold metal-dependent hydrolase